MDKKVAYIRNNDFPNMNNEVREGFKKREKNRNFPTGGGAPSDSGSVSHIFKFIF